jgi:hypothetical protein
LNRVVCLRRVPLAWIASALSLGCAGGPQASPPAKTETHPESSPAATAPNAHSKAPEVHDAGIAKESPKAPLATISGLKFELELAAPIRAIALAEPPRVGVLADEPRVRDARGWRSLPLPVALRARAGETEDLGIYFGRDNRLRLMGTRRSSSETTAVYLRWLDTGWRDGRDEIGRLGATKIGGLYGVLGIDDPEVVCRAGDVCIIKRVSGWVTIGAPQNPRLVTIRESKAWSLDEAGVSALEKDAWGTPTGPKLTAPRSFWTDGDTTWILSDAGRLTHVTRQGTDEEPAPIQHPVSVFGRSSSEVWLAGEGGVALHDGKVWRLVEGAPTGLRVVLARGGDELWFGGTTGLYRLVKP